MILSIIIPVHNDPEGLTRLLRQLQDMAVFDQIIVSDDASDMACRPADLGFDEMAMGVTYLRSDQQRGAGHARNQALAEVTSDHVLFFDSDDLLSPEFPSLLQSLIPSPSQSLDDMAFDFCIFRHIDSRSRAEGVLGPMDSDQRLWDALAGDQGGPRLLEATEVATLAMVAAYPWNKIYRTGFLRDQNIRCTEIQVHNDIELHWSSFLMAKRVLATRQLGCEHFVAENGVRLTNRRGRERLHVFDALEPLHGILTQTSNAPLFLVPLVRFYIHLFDWILQRLDAQYSESFHQKISQFLLAQHSPATISFVAAQDPDLARQINVHIRRGWA
ncbi:glycosyltransferase [Pseudophaeobacter sp.]|jgi:glycosyltransferase involved in cell wall biosynthesis|uniref:glycosyltransferase family 2 protein n=1 Tax=Pseudophaeobacter sp. TaxID=1971739 RepID=UPI0032D94507